MPKNKTPKPSLSIRKIDITENHEFADRDEAASCFTKLFYDGFDVEISIREDGMILVRANKLLSE